MHAVALFSLLAGLTAAAPTTSIKAANLARSIVARAPAGANPVLKSVTSTGSGCNANSAQFVYNDQASVVFDAMVVSTDVRTTSCVLEFDLELDPAWKYTVDKRGQLQGYSEGGNGRFKSTFSLAGQTSTYQVAIPINGDVNLSYGGRDGITSQYGGGKTTVIMDLTLLGTQPGFLSIDSFDMAFDYSQ